MLIPAQVQWPNYSFGLIIDTGDGRYKNPITIFLPSMLEALAKSIHKSIRIGGCARLQEPFLKSVCTIVDREAPFDSLIASFCKEYGFDVRRESPAVYVFTLY